VLLSKYLVVIYVPAAATFSVAVDSSATVARSVAVCQSGIFPNVKAGIVIKQGKGSLGILVQNSYSKFKTIGSVGAGII
jgi:hypothetical protein